MKYTDITSTEDIQASIDFLQKWGRSIAIDEYRSQYEIGPKRPIMDPVKRPDKYIKNEQGENTRVSPVTRIPIPIQKRIVGSTVSFTFGNPVELSTEEESANAQTIMAAVKRILADNKIDSFNRRIARDLARCTEVAECWFPVEAGPHQKYGFSTPFKIRVQSFSPWNGDSLFPVYDATGDMIAFGRGYQRKDGDKEVNYFEVYTDEEVVIWKKDGAGWAELSRTENALQKIPIIYGRQDHVEWHDVELLINRLEKLLSNFGDTNDYFGAPILVVEGEIRGMAEKDTQGKTFQLEQGAKADFISWDQAPEAIKLEAETLLRFIYNLTQTPDISFDSVKGLPDVSGETLKMLFLDAHLKVQDKREVFDEYLQRRMNLLKAFVGVLNTALKAEAETMEIVPRIVPFMIANEKDLIDRLTTANGGKPLISQKTAVGLSGLVDDVDKEYEDLVAEQDRERSFDVTQPTF